jgi:hypothetical protein
VLDTRTRRYYNTASGPAKLVRPENYRATKETLRKYRRADGSRYLLGQPLIVISAASVFGPLFIEEHGQPLYASITNNYEAPIILEVFLNTASFLGITNWSWVKKSQLQ